MGGVKLLSKKKKKKKYLPTDPTFHDQGRKWQTRFLLSMANIRLSQPNKDISNCNYLLEMRDDYYNEVIDVILFGKKTSMKFNNMDALRAWALTRVTFLKIEVMGHAGLLMIPVNLHPEHCCSIC